MPTGTDSSRSEWVKPRELAEREGVHRNTIWRWVEKGLVEAKRYDKATGVRVRVASRSEE